VTSLARHSSARGIWRLALASALVLAVAAQARRASAVGVVPDFVGDFADFNSPDWRKHWGIISDDLKCEIANGKTTCNWGYQNLKQATDPETPAGFTPLEVTYPAPSGPPSCGCGLGGGQLYQDLKAAGQTSLLQSPTIDLKYYYNFPVGFDFGKSTAGKMPGLYGGPPGCESGGVHCGGAWSTRYMWRGGSSSAPSGEIYFYAGTASGYGADLGGGSWHFQADGKWHSIEQLIDLPAGNIKIWHDGAMVFQTTRSFGGTPLSGIFFSTFHGGHDTGWSPSKLTRSHFAAFTLSTEGPQTAAMPPGLVTGSSDAGATATDAGAPPAGGAGGGGGGGAPAAGGSGPGAGSEGSGAGGGSAPSGQAGAGATTAGDRPAGASGCSLGGPGTAGRTGGPGERTAAGLLLALGALAAGRRRRGTAAPRG
jgi:hypothetical protein